MTMAISLVAILISYWFQYHRKKLANDRMLKELFKEFNERYDKLNNDLNKVSRMSIEEWSSLYKEEMTTLYSVVIDYFNICAEEYYWYKRKKISPKIWKSWSRGMNDIYNRSEVIRLLWEMECENGDYESYYINKPNAFFKKRL